MIVERKISHDAELLFRFVERRHHKTLFDLFQLAKKLDINIDAKQLPNTMLGKFFVLEGRICLSLALARSPRLVVPSLAHELTHALQFFLGSKKRFALLGIVPTQAAIAASKKHRKEYQAIESEAYTLENDPSKLIELANTLLARKISRYRSI